MPVPVSDAMVLTNLLLGLFCKTVWEIIYLACSFLPRVFLADLDKMAFKVLRVL